LNGDELQGNVWYQRQHPGDGNGERQEMGHVAAADEIGRRHVSVLPAHAPQTGHEHEDDRVHNHRVGKGEEPESPDAVDERRDGGHRIRGVKVAAE
jgi:hypothetical protein